MRKRHCGAFLLASSVLVAACGGSATSPGASANDAGPDARATLPTPKTHRPTAASCPTTRDGFTGPPMPMVAGSQCTADADCTAGRNGRCFSTQLGGGPNVCSYDACVVDDDCGTPRVCNCRNPASFGANVCFNGNCRIDADCGRGGFCSPSLVDLGSNCVGVPPGSVGYFCHVATDECTNDDDCATSAGLGMCSFDVGALHWKCYAARCTG